MQEGITAEGNPMRKLVLVLAMLTAFAAPAAASAHGGQPHGGYPHTIPLPNGFAPEGFEISHGTTFYVGSVANGAIYTGDLRSGQGHVLVPGAVAPATDAATGLEYDHGLLWVAGAGTGALKVYQAKTGALLHTYQLGTPPSTFLNDVVVTRTAVYVTDSQQPVIYKISLKWHHADAGAVSTIPLTGDYQHVGGGQLNLNGLVAVHGGKTLIAVQTAAKKLFQIDPATGVTTAIDTGAYDLANGDGLLLQGHWLSVVQNRSNTIAVFKLARDLSAATFAKAITDPAFDVPTSIDSSGRHAWVVNARFGTSTPTDQHYDVVKVG
jgi:sugar lactone lactonase YvrE